MSMLQRMILLHRWEGRRRAPPYQKKGNYPKGRKQVLAFLTYLDPSDLMIFIILADLFNGPYASQEIIKSCVRLKKSPAEIFSGALLIGEIRLIFIKFKSGRTSTLEESRHSCRRLNDDSFSEWCMDPCPLCIREIQWLRGCVNDAWLSTK